MALWTNPSAFSGFDGIHFESVRALLRAGAKLDEADADMRSLQLRFVSELRCFDKDNMSPEQVAKINELLRKVRLAGSWASYVTEERRALATLMALWKRQRRNGIATSPHRLTLSQESKTPRGVGSALTYEGASEDVEILLKVFELPPGVSGRVLRFYTDLVL